METSPGTNVSGFCYVGRNGRGDEILIPGSFGTSRTKAKSRLDNINRVMCVDHRPKINPVAIVACTLTIHGVVREFGAEGETE